MTTIINGLHSDVSAYAPVRYCRSLRSGNFRGARQVHTVPFGDCAIAAKQDLTEKLRTPDSSHEEAPAPPDQGKTRGPTAVLVHAPLGAGARAVAVQRDERLHQQPDEDPPLVVRP